MMITLIRCRLNHCVPSLSLKLLALALAVTGITPFRGQSSTFEEGRSPSLWVHVATSGNDTSGNGTLEAPYRSIARGASQATPGAAVVIHPGTYSGRAYLSNLAGTEAEPIWIGGAPGMTKPILRDADEAIHLTKVRYLILHDLEVSHCTMNGINTDDGGEFSNAEATRHLVFRNLLIHSIGSGGNQDCLKLSGVRDYHILDCVFENGSAGGSGIDHVGCHRGTIKGNRFTNMGSNAIQCKGGSSDIEIRGNYFEDCGQRAINIGGSTGFGLFRPPLSTIEPNFEARNIRISANLFIGSTTPFAFVGATDCVVANNTIIHPGNWILRILQETSTSGSYTFGPCANNSVTNNIFWFDRSQISPSNINVGNNTAPSTFQFSHNLWYNTHTPSNSSPSGIPVEEASPLHGTDPLFVNESTQDFKLLQGSPAAASGIAHPTLSFDHGGNAWASPPSRGAWEADWRLNQAPQLEPIGAKSIPVGQSLEFQVSATDPDQDELSFSATTPPLL